MNSYDKRSEFYDHLKRYGYSYDKVRALRNVLMMLDLYPNISFHVISLLTTQFAEEFKNE